MFGCHFDYLFSKLWHCKHQLLITSGWAEEAGFNWCSLGRVWLSLMTLEVWELILLCNKCQERCLGAGIMFTVASIQHPPTEKKVCRVLSRLWVMSSCWHLPASLVSHKHQYCSPPHHIRHNLHCKHQTSQSEWPYRSSHLCMEWFQGTSDQSFEGSYLLT